MFASQWAGSQGDLFRNLNYQSVSTFSYILHSSCCVQGRLRKEDISGKSELLVLLKTVKHNIAALEKMHIKWSDNSM